MYEGRHNHSSGDKQNHQAQTCDSGRAAAVIRQLKQLYAFNKAHTS